MWRFFLPTMLAVGICASSTRPLIRGRFTAPHIQRAAFAHSNYSFSKRCASRSRLQRSTSASIRYRCTAQSARFEVGDEILIDWDGESNTSYKSGTIEEVRGGGWYTVRLRDDAIRVKRRGNQLQKKEEVRLDRRMDRESIEAPLPEVEIVDLDSIQHDIRSEQHPLKETIEQIQACHTKYTRWIIFSDLHVMPSTLSTCLQILDFLHNAAIERNAGILFLGDFWHHRGFVRVDCLNAVLESMSKWRVPSIMIPGNHDQVNWAGTEHALTPLKDAYRINCDAKTLQFPGPLIVSHPTKFMNALFVPHIRDKSTMKAILASEEAMTSCALFVHADVKGASMNDLIKSQHGISADTFPTDKCVYSGHFHMPHTVRIGGSEIRYVGSPYQISLNEAGQRKALLLVDANENWNCTEKIPIDIGPRYHRHFSVSSFLRGISETSLRAGDKVSLSIPQNELEEMRMAPDSNTTLFDAKIKELRDAGIDVEIRNVQTDPIRSSVSSEDEELELEDLSPIATLEEYIKNEVAIGALKETSAETLLNDGRAILDELSNDLNGDAVPSSRSKNAVTIELDSVSIAGFGSFRKEVTYPLNKRGVVLLRGSNKDFGSDSNGVGKSTLAHASLWALVGSLDARPVQDGKVVHIVNDLSKRAEVTLRGKLNKKDFVVKRTKNMSAGSSLSFTLDGADLTLQSPSDTQKLINEHFAQEPQLLTRSIFHGQHSIGTLLESSDAKLKDELSTLISLDIWQSAASLVRTKQRESQRKVSELDGMLLIRQKDASDAIDKCQSAEYELNRRKSSIMDEQKSLIAKEKALSYLDSNILEDSVKALQTELGVSNDRISQLEHELHELTTTDNSRLTILRSQLEKTMTAQTKAENDLQFSTHQYDSKKIHLGILENQLNTTGSWDFRDSNQTMTVARSICKTCGQKITSEESIEFLRQSTAARIDSLTTQIQLARQDLAKAECLKHNAIETASAISEDVHKQRAKLQREEDSLARRSQDLREQLKAARHDQAEQSLKYSTLIKQSQEVAQSKIALSEIHSQLQRLNDSLAAASDFYETCCSNVKSVEKTISDIESTKATVTQQASSYGSLLSIFGKSIQSFVLNKVVTALQYYSQSYLDVLSDGSLRLGLEVGQNDSIMKHAQVLSADGTWRMRPLSSLSGGQWRRCSLSLSLGFVDLASHRGKLRSSLLVLDEPLTHLDSSGRDSVGKLLRKMLSNSEDDQSAIETQIGGLGLSTILVILQDIAAEEIEECFDCIDEVIKSEGESHVVLGHHAFDMNRH